MNDKGRILLVDDDRDILRGLRIRLEAAGYDVPVAHDGQAGLDAATASPPDAIVLDLRMPRLDGFSVLSSLRTDERTNKIPVVVLSANAVEKAKTKALDLGARYFLEKPYDAKNLIGAIEAAMTNQRPHLAS